MISFAAPWVLAGLVLAGIPIVLHLLANREPTTVPFPGTRYLALAAELSQRRLKLRHLLLLLLRTLLIILLVLAAAGPSVPSGGLGSHVPIAAVLVLDNSASSSAIRDGQATLTQLRRAAAATLDRARAEDRIWIITADGIPRTYDLAALRRLVSQLEPVPARLDLGSAVMAGQEVLASQDRPGEILVFSDFQKSAVAPFYSRFPVVAAKPTGKAPRNVGVSALRVGPQPWGPEGGIVSVGLSGDSGAERPATIRAGTSVTRQVVIPARGEISQRVGNLGVGWWEITAQLEPDEFRNDDARSAVVRVVPPAKIQWDLGDRFLSTAAQVLVESRRVARGSEVSLGRLGTGASIVQPPADPAAIAALNRALANRGCSWRYDRLLLAPATVDSNAWVSKFSVRRRYRLVFQGGGVQDVLAKVGADPWLTRCGAIVLAGSRFDPEWTELPLLPGFVPLIDGLVNRAVRGEFVRLDAAPNRPVAIPDRVSAIAGKAGSVPVEGGAPLRLRELGAHFLLDGHDTVGVVQVNLDPRESDLTPATDHDLEASWPKVRITNAGSAQDVAFQSAARRDLRGIFLGMVLALSLTELAVAGTRRR